MGNSNRTLDEKTRDGYYCLAIALFTGCTVEKAIALYENESVWVTDDILDEMVHMREVEGLSLQQMARIYGLSKTQLLYYLNTAELRKLGIRPSVKDV